MIFAILRLGYVNYGSLDIIIGVQDFAITASGPNTIGNQRSVLPSIDRDEQDVRFVRRLTAISSWLNYASNGCVASFCVLILRTT